MPSNGFEGPLSLWLTGVCYSLLNRVRRSKISFRAFEMYACLLYNFALKMQIRTKTAKSRERERKRVSEREREEREGACGNDPLWI
jgi:hypothetical protein